MKAARNSAIGCACLLAVIEGVGIGFQRMMADNTRLDVRSPLTFLQSYTNGHSYHLLHHLQNLVALVSPLSHNLPITISNHSTLSVSWGDMYFSKDTGAKIDFLALRGRMGCICKPVYRSVANNEHIIMKRVLRGLKKTKSGELLWREWLNMCGFG